MRLFQSAGSMGIALARLAGLALLLLFLGLRVADPLVVSSIRNQGFDILQRLHPRPAAAQPIAIVDIDEKSLELVGQWPWPRTEVARLIDRLTAMGAVVIGFDVVFAEPDRLSPDRVAEDNPDLPETARTDLLKLPSNETVLANAIARSRVVVGETSVRVDDETLAGGDRPIPDVPYAALGGDATPYLLKFPRLVQNLPVISDAAAGRGLFTVEPDPDGIFRRIPLVMMVQDHMRLALSAEMLRIATGGQAFATRAGDAGIEGIVVGGVFVPTDGNGRVWPWFNASSRDRYVSAGAVMSGEAPAERIAGHLVVIGTSAVGLEDFRATPVANFMPGVEIHAQIIENILTQQFLQRPAYAIGMELLVTFVVGAFIVWLVPRIGAFYSFFAAVSVLGLVAAGVYWAFLADRMLIDATFPGGALAAVFMVMATANYMREERQRRQIRSAFGQYLSPTLVDRLADHPEQLVLGGETRELTLLFTDVRGFTTISESFKANPQGLTRLMNRFLTALSGAILDRDGTIDKYMGDAIMAFWNAPVDLPDHPMRACRAGLDMVRRVEELNSQRRQEVERDPGEPFHEIRIGVGINSGPCVVGNMGSDMRFDYTALGDTVNLASRLEGQSKPYGVSIVLGDATAAAVADTLALIEIDLLRVKGKNEPERIHSLLGVEDMVADPTFQALKQANGTMLERYRACDWDAAAAALAEMAPLAKRLGAALDGYLDLYASRIVYFRDNPPEDGWDGVYTALTK
ncbi:CHASE2 domain-containing protein [Mesorhizobium sp. ZMM04-5]|uniref:CHASE2 domain-containing protein n=1 Tax=Mesorhizobium marinum TaxID=3228790 RepID=A0ABV3QUR5_9HYPH